MKPILLWLCAFTAGALAESPSPEKPKSKLAAKLEQSLVDRIENFELDLIYYGPKDKPFDRVTLSVQPLKPEAGVALHSVVQIDKAQALKIVSWLTEQGFFDRAIDDIIHDITLRAPDGPTYWLTVGGDKLGTRRLQWHEDLGWNLSTIRRLESLRTVLEKKPAAALDLLLARLAELRHRWEVEAPAKP